MENDERKHSIKSMINAIKVAQTVTISGNEIVIFPKSDFDELTTAMQYLMQEVTKPRIEIAQPIVNAEPEEPKPKSKRGVPKIVVTEELLKSLKEPDTNPDALLTPQQVATEWCITLKALEKWRFDGTNLPFMKMGNGPKSIVRYRRKDVVAFIEAHMRNSTSEFQAATVANGSR